jgi:predicted DNA-binding transcriptional regulator AlpA
MSDETTTSSSLLPAKMVQERYHVSDRTIDRWERLPELNFPQPVRINGRRYFRIAELMEWEHTRARAANSKAVRDDKAVALDAIK